MKKFILLVMTAVMALSFCAFAVNAQDAEPAFVVSDDEEEIYFVADELRGFFPGLVFIRVSHCAGVLVLARSEFGEADYL